jgi:hypothetical protein
MTRILWITFLCFIITACQTNAAGTQAGICKELKHRIIFNGATSNDTLAAQQRAELNTLNQNYRNQGCG